VFLFFFLFFLQGYNIQKKTNDIRFTRATEVLREKTAYFYPEAEKA